jgi:hypothetical protein
VWNKAGRIIVAIAGIFLITVLGFTAIRDPSAAVISKLLMAVSVTAVLYIDLSRKADATKTRNRPAKTIIIGIVLGLSLPLLLLALIMAIVRT